MRVLTTGLPAKSLAINLLSRFFRRRNDLQDTGGKVNIGRQKIFVIHISDKGSVSRIYEELNYKKTTQLTNE